MAVVNDWDLQLVAILGHLNFALFSFWATTLILGVSSTDKSFSSYVIFCHSFSFPFDVEGRV